MKALCNTSMYVHVLKQEETVFKAAKVFPNLNRLQNVKVSGEDLFPYPQWKQNTNSTSSEAPTIYLSVLLYIPGR